MFVSHSQYQIPVWKEEVYHTLFSLDNQQYHDSWWDDRYIYLDTLLFRSNLSFVLGGFHKPVSDFLMMTRTVQTKLRERIAITFCCSSRSSWIYWIIKITTQHKECWPILSLLLWCQSSKAKIHLERFKFCSQSEDKLTNSRSYLIVSTSSFSSSRSSWKRLFIDGFRR